MGSSVSVGFPKICNRIVDTLNTEENSSCQTPKTSRMIESVWFDEDSEESLEAGLEFSPHCEFFTYMKQNKLTVCEAKKYVLKYPDCLFLEDRESNTALHFACKNENTDMVCMLMKQKIRNTRQPFNSCDVL